MALILQVTSITLHKLVMKNFDGVRCGACGLIAFTVAWLTGWAVAIVAIYNSFNGLSLFFYGTEVIVGVLGTVLFDVLVKRIFRLKNKPEHFITPVVTADRDGNLCSGLLIIMIYLIVYMVVLVPVFRSASMSVRLLILLVGHPLLKTSLEYIIRDMILRSDVAPHFACGGLFGIDAIFGLVGRFFIVTSGGKSVDGALLAILFAGVQQYTCRSMRIDFTAFSRWFRGKPAMTELELARLKSIVAVEERQCMACEVACIIVATVYELSLWEFRWFFDLGYGTTAERPPLHQTLLLCALQIATEALVDVLAVYRELKSGIPLLNVWQNRNKVWVFKEMVQMALAAVLICCMIYHVVPIAGFCARPNDVCSCSFTDSLPAVAEYCGMDAASVDRASAEAAANATSVLRRCVAARCSDECGGACVMSF